MGKSGADVDFAGDYPYVYSTAEPAGTAFDRIAGLYAWVCVLIRCTECKALAALHCGTVGRNLTGAASEISHTFAGVSNAAQRRRILSLISLWQLEDYSSFSVVFARGCVIFAFGAAGDF